MADELIKILLVDDDEEDYIITREVLSEIEDRRFDIEWVANYDAALEVIDTSRFDVCLVDYHLGARNGLQLLSEVVGNGCKTPIILLTGQGDREVDIQAMEVDIQAMEAGAEDYLVKSRIDAFLLERSIRYSIQRSKEQELKEELEQQLLQFQKMESIGRLAGGIAHELNNLLTPVMGYTQLMVTQPTTETQQSNLEQIDRAATRAADLVQQLLTFSHRQVIEPRVFLLNHLIADMGTMLRRLINEDIELVVLPRPDGRNCTNGWLRSFEEPCKNYEQSRVVRQRSFEEPCKNYEQSRVVRLVQNNQPQKCRVCNIFIGGS